MVQQRNEVMRWASEERRKTEEYCSEQRAAAVRERRATAKQAREAREREQLSVRKERAEVDALEATVEKLKLDLERSSKKAKANERRLSQLLKDTAENVDRLERQCYQLELERIDVWSLLEGTSLATSLKRVRLGHPSIHPSIHVYRSLSLSLTLTLMLPLSLSRTRTMPTYIRTCSACPNCVLGATVVWTALLVWTR